MRMVSDPRSIASRASRNGTPSPRRERARAAGLPLRPSDEVTSFRQREMPRKKLPVPRGGRVSIREARALPQVECARTLFLEYRAWLVAHREVTDFPDSVLETGLKLFDQEFDELPGDYAPPSGALFLAYEGATPIGCAALRALGPETAEFKRLFVRPTQRSSGVGRRLTVRALRRAGELGYSRVVLDTLPRMVRAIALYRKLGFRPIQPYWAHPVPNALFFEFRLQELERTRPPAQVRRQRSR